MFESLSMGVHHIQEEALTLWPFARDTIYHEDLALERGDC